MPWWAWLLVGAVGPWVVYAIFVFVVLFTLDR